MTVLIGMMRSDLVSGSEVEVTTSCIASSIGNEAFSIPIKVHEPRSVLRAVVLFIHGGMFSLGDRDSHPSISMALASQLNLAVVTVSFRNGSLAPNQTGVSMRDLIDVIHFCRERTHWRGLPLGLVGASSGGFFALTLSQTLNGIQFCIPICPVSNPFLRAAYLRSCISGTAVSDGYSNDDNYVLDPIQAQYVLDKQLSFWKPDDSHINRDNTETTFDYDDTSMKQAGDFLKKNHNNVPTLLILASRDKNVPLKVTADVQSWATRTVVIGEKGHEISDDIQMDATQGTYQSYLPDIDRFLETSVLVGKR